MRENTKEGEQQERVGRRIEIVVPRREKDKQIKIRYCCMCRSK